MRNPILALSLLLTLPVLAQRQMEGLGRGVIATRTGSSTTHVSWRMLGSDDDDISFKVYRSINGGAGSLRTTVTATTDYQDSPGSGTLNGSSVGYYVVPVIDGVDQAASATWTLPASSPTVPYFEVPFTSDPDIYGPYDTKFAWVGDFNGDGEYDFLCDRLSTVGGDGYEQFLEAYLQDGTYLWRMRMGPNSLSQANAYEPGASSISVGDGDNVTCFDLDGDGMAEAIVRTANGVTVTNSSGSTVASIAAGNNTDQFLTVIDGMTGVEIDSAPVPNNWSAHGTLQSKCFIAYLDGKHPSVILYGYNRANSGEFYRQWTAWDFIGGALVQRWTWAQNPSTQPGSEGHQVRIADVDNDGRDEIVDIGHVMDDDGTQLYVTELTHGDRFHVADINPLWPGLETFAIQQNNPTFLATAYQDSATGSFHRKWYTTGIIDVGRGLTLDMDPNYLGMEMFSTQPGIFNAESDEVWGSSFFPYEGLWWDGNRGREIIRGTNGAGTSPAIEKYNGAGGTNRMYINGNNVYDYSVHNAYGGRPAFWGDILGDWREELVLTKNDYSGLRIFTTAEPAQDRRRTLMHNAQYRVQTTTKGYVQASYVDYYLGYETPEDPPPPIDDTDHTWVSGPTFNSTTCPNGESILFDLSGDNSSTISLSGTLQPSRVKVFSPIDYTFGGTGSLAGTGDLLKSGAGSLTLTGSHSFSGPTAVWDGALIVDGTLSSSPVTVHGGTWGAPLAEGETGGRLGGSGTVSQPVVIDWRGAIVPGDGNGHAATLSLGGGLTCEDATAISLDLSNAATSDLVAVTGNLTLNGTTTLVIHKLDPTLDPGTHTLITYTGAFNGTLNDFEVMMPSGEPYSLSDTGSAIQLTVPVTRAATSITWDGGSNGNAWDVFNTTNFLDGATPEKFVPGDTVTFDDTGSPNTSVNLDGGLFAAGVTVNSSLNYTFNGPGTIEGSGGLTKDGTGTLNVGEDHGFTGPVTINGGTLAVTSLADGGVPSSIGAGSTSPTDLVLNGGTLRHDGPQTGTNRGMRLEAGGGTLELPGNSLQLGGTINGPGALTKAGNGLLLIAGSNSYAGGTHVDQGTLQLTSDTANASGLGSGPVTFHGGTLSMTDNSNSYNSASYNLVVPAGESGRLNADSRVYLGGTLTGDGDFTFYTPFVRTDLQGDWSGFNGNLHVIADGDGGDFRIDNTFGYGGCTLDLGPDIWAYYMPGMGSNLTLDIGALSGDAAANLNGGQTAGRTLTWRIGNKNVDATYNGAINNSSSTTAVTKIGTGIQTFTGPLTYSGTTTVSGGVLRINGTSSSSNFSVQNGGLLGGTGTITGNVTLNSGGGLELGASPLAITGNITASGTITIQPAGSPGTGTFVVATYTGSFSGSPTWSWGGAGSASFSTSGNQISVTVSNPATKVHHYTFNDNTFTDLVGTLDGTTSGAATLSGGSLVLTGGSGEFNAASLAINTYGSVSLEFWATSNDAANTGFHALLGLGEVNPLNAGLASNYVLFTTHRGDNVIRGAIATNNQDLTPFLSEDGVNTPEINDASEHHYVLTISGSQLELFVDGASVGTQPTTQSLANVATDIAAIGRLYANDANWQGNVNEFAIYQGTLSPSEVAAAYAAGPDLSGGDSDGDGLLDDWEIAHFGNLRQTGTGDPDGDGYDNEAEETAGTDPNDAAFTPDDTDGDGLADAWEIAHFSGGPTGPVTVANSSTPVVVNNTGSTVGANGILFTSSSFDMTGGNAVALLLTTEGGDTSLVHSVTFAGQPMNEVRANQGSQVASIYYLVNPSITSGMFDFTLDSSYAGTIDYAYTAVSLAGVEDFADSDTDTSTASNDTTPLSVSYTTHTDGGYVLGTAVNNDYNGTALAVSSGNPDTEFLPFTNPDTSGHFHVGGDVATAGFYTDEYVGQIQRNAVATVAFDGATADPLAQTGNADPDGDGFDNEAEETAGSDPNDGSSVPGDTDGDDLDDAWEIAHFGNLDQTGTDDPDGDGFDNEAEETAGTDPTDGAYTPDDTDGDGLADAWESAHFGDLSHDANGDADGDGTLEWLEEALGYDPNNPNEAFRASIVKTGPGSYQLEWPNADGVTFTVESMTTHPPSWSADVVVPGSTSPATLTHPITPGQAFSLHRVSASQP